LKAGTRAGAVGRGPDPRLAAWPSLALALLLFLTKAVHWRLPEPTSRRLGEYARDLLVSSHLDVTFAVLLGGAAALALSAARGRPGLQRGVWSCFLGAAALSGAYAVASVQIFAFLRSPLTYPLLYLAGDMRNMRSSIGSFLSPALVAALVAAPAALLALGRAARAWKPPRWTWVLPLVAAAHFGYGRWVAAGRWSDRDDRLIAESPHMVLITSLAREASGAGSERFDEPFPPELLADFEPGASAGGWEGGPPPRNLVLVVLESTGTQYLGLYGSPYETTPVLASEAEHTIVFDDQYAHVGMSANALVSMMLSIHPFMTWREYPAEYPDYPGTTLAQRLKGAGLRTAYLHTGDLSYANQRAFLAGRGFDAIRDRSDLDCAVPSSSWGCEDRDLVDALIRFVDEDPEAPFFAWAWSAQSHHPYEPSPDRPFVDFFAGRAVPPDDYDLGRYLNTLLEADRQLGRLFEALRERGIADDTLVAVTGDHGEAFGDPHDTWGHGSRLYEENLRVPLILWCPRLFSGERRDVVGGHVDLAPTLAEIMGVAGAPTWQGRSLFARSRPPRAYFYAANDDYLLGLREGSWKYVYNATTGRELLFDLAADPRESESLAGEHPQRSRRMRQRLAAWRAAAEEDLSRARRGAPARR
jgi:arylsulfatase A-like enzyme